VLSQRLPRDARDRTIRQYTHGLLLESLFVHVQSSSLPIAGLYGQNKAKRPSQTPGGHRGETGSRNMAATQKIERALMT